MNKRTILHTLGFMVVISAIVIALTPTVDRSPNSEQAPEQRVETPLRETITLTIEGFYDAKEVPVSRDETVLDVLQTLNTENETLQLETKEYGSMGTLVEGMNGMRNGTGNKYWQYRVNGEMPQVGAGTYTLAPGDAVEWYFAASEF